MGKRLDRIKDALESTVLSRIRSKNIFAEYYSRTEKKAQWKRQVVNYSAKEINDWKLAVMAFTDPENPRAGEWMRFRQTMMLDNHLASVIDTRILRIIRSSYKIVNEKTGEENEALKELLERPWHDDLIRLVVGKIFNGRTLIEFFDTDENGELVRVSEIPQSNFIPQKGIIIKEEFDNNGVSYTDGIYKDYYLQVGGDWEIGMLNELAMIVLAKKLGLGSWMSYIDTLGIPPIFAITDRMDTARRDELFEMLTDFRSNRFVVLQGNEKIEVPDYSTDAYQSFKALNEFCDNQMTKRVLGGTALTDEKSFVGTATIQEKMMLDRYESDKQFYKYVFNQFVRQRLAKISNVYKDFSTHKLVWDNQETLNITGYIDAVQKLSTAFEFDHEEISKRTGLPIIGVKSASSPSAEPDPQKKKTSGKVKDSKPLLLYGLSKIPEVNARTWDDAVERLANDLWNGNVKPEDLDKDIVLKNYATLSSAAETGWGKQYYSNDKARMMRDNLIKFAGYKAYNLMSAIEAGKAGKTKEEFIEHAKKVVTLHNDRYLKVERNFASAKAAAARDYLRYLEESDIYPYLKLRTMEDGDVRPAHAAMDGLVKKVEDWKFIPPFEPNCRCRLEQTLDPATTDIPEQEFNEQYANNPALSGEVFTSQHNYFNSTPKSINGTIKGNTDKVRIFAPYMQDPKYSKLKVNQLAHIREVDENITTARTILDSIGEIKGMLIRPHTEAHGVSNPEYVINNVLADAKRIKTVNGIKDGISKASKQGCKYVVFDLNKHFDKNIPLDTKIIEEILSKKALTKEARKMKGYIFVFGNQAVLINSKVAKTGNFENLLKKLRP